MNNNITPKRLFSIKMLKFFLVCSGIVFITSGCTKETLIEQVTDVNGSAVKPYYYFSQIEGVEGVTVQMESGTYKKETVTDELGTYTFQNVPVGTYNLTFSKDGYGTYKKYGFQLVGGTIPAEVPQALMIKLPDYLFDELTVSAYGYQFLDYPASLKIRFEYEQKNGGYYRLLLSQDPDISLINYSHAIREYFYSDSGYKEVNVSYNDYPAGTKWYVMALPEQYDVSYLDPDTGKDIYYAANNAAKIITSFVIPEPETN